MAWTPPYLRRPKPAPEETRSPSLSELALDELKSRYEEEAPFGGWGGELAVPRPAEPSMPGSDQRPRFPPPPWSENYIPELDEPALAEEQPDRFPPVRREPA